MPGRASVECDCRVLPGTSRGRPGARSCATALGDDLPYELEFLERADRRHHRADRHARCSTPASSFVERNDPGAILLPIVSTGFTDSHFMRETFGTVAYGFWPSRHTPLEVLHAGVHNRDERIHRRRPRLRRALPRRARARDQRIRRLTPRLTLRRRQLVWRAQIRARSCDRARRGIGLNRESGAHRAGPAVGRVTIGRPAPRLTPDGRNPGIVTGTRRIATARDGQPGPASGRAARPRGRRGPGRSRPPPQDTGERIVVRICSR